MYTFTEESQLIGFWSRSENQKFSTIIPILYEASCDPNPGYIPDFTLTPDSQVEGTVAEDTSSIGVVIGVLGGGVVGIIVLAVLALLALAAVVAVVVGVVTVCCVWKRRKGRDVKQVTPMT